MLAGNVLPILLCLISGPINSLARVQITEAYQLPCMAMDFASVEIADFWSSHSAPAAIAEVSIGKGFLFVEGRYCSVSTTLSWSDGYLDVDDPTASMVACEMNIHRTSSSVSDAFSDVEVMGLNSCYDVSDEQLTNIRQCLKSGGVVNLTSNSDPFCVDFSSGGFEILEALNHEPGPEREALVDMAISEGGVGIAPEIRSWLSNYRPDSDLSGRVESLVKNTHRIEKSNVLAAKAMKRFHLWTYPLTIAAMMLFVVSIGSLLEARPQEMVAVAHQQTDVSINRFLWLIAGMSLVDLVWTLLAHQANQIAEVNPVGNVLLGDTMRTILFKGLATAMAIGILFKARESQFARKACWWVCLILAMLMGRWVLVSGVSV